jgi:hypothetical protein
MNGLVPVAPGRRNANLVTFVTNLFLLFLRTAPITAERGNKRPESSYQYKNNFDGTFLRCFSCLIMNEYFSLLVGRADMFDCVSGKNAI